jgi:hypothetical protein
VTRGGGGGARRSLLITALALSASASGLANGFAYDDRPIIRDNDRIHDLSNAAHVFAQTYWPPKSGAALYRPLTVLAFTWEWAVGRGSPAVFHAVNVALYLAIAIAAFRLASAMLPMPAAWIAAALFAVHPVHVEVVANVVGQGELFTALAVVAAAGFYVRERASRPLTWRATALLLVLYALAFFGKEHGIMLPAILVAAEMTVVNDQTPWRERWTALRPMALAFVAAGLALIALRTSVVGGFAGDGANIAFVHATFAGRVWTMVNVAREWARLLVWPAHLVANYSPPMVGAYRGFVPELLPGVVVVAGAVALLALCWRRRPVAAFGLAWTMIALVPASNILVPSGVLLGERTLFLPSVGAVLVAGDAAVWATGRLREAGVRALRLGALAVTLVLGLGAWRSAARQPVWRDNQTLFEQTTRDAPDSYRAHQAWGGMLFELKRRPEAEQQYRQAMALYHEDSDVYAELANEYRIAHLCVPAIPLYRQALEIFPARDDARVGLTACHLELAQWRPARSQATVGLAQGRSRDVYLKLRGIADSAIAAGMGRPAAPSARPRP